MRFFSFATLTLTLTLALAACSHADESGGDDAAASAAGGEAGSSGEGGSGGAPGKAGSGGSGAGGQSSAAGGSGGAGAGGVPQGGMAGGGMSGAGMSGAGMSGAGASGGAGTSGGAGAAGGSGSAGASGSGQAGTGQAGTGQSGSSGQSGQAGQGGSAGGPAGAGGAAGAPFGAGGSAGAPFGGGGSSGQAGDGGGGSGGASGSGGTGAAPGWTCGVSQYATGDKWPACNCDCGVYDPDCDDPDSYVKGCDTGQTCGKDGKCQGEVLSPPSSWVCGSAYYGIGGKVPVCNCGCGAPDPDCSLPHPTYDLTSCKKGQTCGADGTCQGPELSVPATWTCDPSRFAQGKTSGTCDCECGAVDPDCADVNLKLTGCGYTQTCDAQGHCQGEIAPAPSGWTCPSNTYSDGKVCNCACGIIDPDCDQFLGLPDDCGLDAFCGSITNECIQMAN